MSNMWKIKTNDGKTINEYEKYYGVFFYYSFASTHICQYITQTYRPHYFNGNVINVIAIHITMHEMGIMCYVRFSFAEYFSCIH